MHKVEENRLTFQANRKKEFFSIVAFVMIFSYTATWAAANFSLPWWLGAALILFYLFYHLLTVRVAEVIVTSAQLTVVRRNFFKTTKYHSYSLAQISFACKRSMSLRGGMKTICSVYGQDKVVFRLVANRNGWSDEVISNFVQALLAKGARDRQARYFSNKIIA